MKFVFSSHKNSGNGDRDRVQKGPGSRYGWVVLIAALLIGFITLGTRLSFGVFFTPLETDFGWTRAATSGIFSVYMLLCAVFGFAGGWAIDRFGAKAVALVMVLFTSMSLLLTSYASELWHFFITYSLFLAIGTAPAFTLGLSTAIRWFTKRRGLAVGIVTSGRDLGILIMSPFTALLIAGFDWRNSFLIMAGIAFIVLVPCALVLKKAPGEELQRKTPAKADDKNPDTGSTRLQIIASRNFWLFSANWLFHAFSIFIISAHLVRHAIDLNIDPIKAAFVFSLVGGISIPGRIIMGRISDNLGRRQVAIASALVGAVAMLWLIRSTDIGMLYAFAVAFGFSTGGLSATVNAYVGDIFGTRHVGFTMGLLNISWAIGAAAGPAFAGYVFDTANSYTTAFLAGTLGLGMVALAIFLTRTKKLTGAAGKPEFTPERSSYR